MQDEKKNKQPDDDQKEPVEDFEIKLNEFGEIRSNLQIEDLNKYLNAHLEDKKLKDRQGSKEEE